MLNKCIKNLIAAPHLLEVTGLEALHTVIVDVVICTEQTVSGSTIPAGIRLGAAQTGGKQEEAKQNKKSRKEKVESRARCNMLCRSRE